MPFGLDRAELGIETDIINDMSPYRWVSWGPEGHSTLFQEHSLDLLAPGSVLFLAEHTVQEITSLRVAGTSIQKGL